MSTMTVGVTPPGQTEVRPRLIGDGPATFSTSATLARRKPWVFDTNRYYAALGVRTDATRQELREAYQRLGGHSNPRLTYIIKQLLDPEVRARYDATPLGSLFIDYDVETQLRMARVREVTRLRSEGREEEAQTLADLPIEAVLDTDGSVEHDGSSQPVEAVWPWAFYLWGSDRQDRERLREWQELLIEALHRRGVHTQLGIGLSGGMAHPWGLATVGYRLVVFLHQDERPTEAHAHAAASRVSSTIHCPPGHRAWR